MEKTSRTISPRPFTPEKSLNNVTVQGNPRIYIQNTEEEEKVVQGLPPRDVQQRLHLKKEKRQRHLKQ